MTLISVKGVLIKLMEKTPMNNNESILYRQFLLSPSENPYEKILVTAIHHNVALLDNLVIGETYEYDIQIKGKEWVNRDGKTTYVTNLNLISVKK